MIFFFLLCCLQTKSQEVLNDVTIEKVNPGLFKVQYRLNPNNEYNVSGITLKILRRREGKVEEVFSENITSAVSAIRSQTYTYNWKPQAGIIKPGDEVQAKIALSLKPSVAKQKPKSSNKAPYADAGNSMEVELPVTKPLVLNGSKSYDDDGKIVSVQWKQIAGPSNLLVSRRDSLVANINGQFKEGTYAFELSVTDDQGATAIGRTILSVKAAPFIVTAPPVNPVPKKPVVATSPVTQKTFTKLKGGPTNAAINLLIPGLGHYFVSSDYTGGNRKAASFIITALYAGSVAGAYYFNLKYTDQYKKYNELANYREYQEDANGLIIGVRGGNETEANKFFNNAKSSQRNSMICLGIAGGILVSDFVYTFIRGSKNKKEWKEATSFKPNLFISSDGSSTAIGLRFKF